MLRIVCEEFEELQPVALLIGNQNYQDNDGKNKYVSKWFDQLKTWLAKIFTGSKKK